MAWGKAGSNTLTVAGDTLTVSGTASEFNQIMSHIPFTTYGGGRIIFDNDSGNNYGDRYSLNGASDSVSTNQPDIFLVADNTTYDQFSIAYICNIDGKESLLIGFGMNQGAVGAGAVPPKREIVGKWYSTTQFTRIDITNENPTLGDFLVDSNLTVLGSDITPAAAVPFPTNVQVGSRAEITDSRKMYNYTNPLTFEDDFTSYADISAGNAVWVSENTSYSYVDVNNDNLKINQPYSTSVHAYVAKDLGTNVSNTAWVCRYKLNFSTWNTSSEFHLTLHEADQTVANNATGYNVAGIRISAQTSPDLIQVIATSSGSDRSSVGSGSSFTVSTGTDYYVEMIRNGNDFTVTVRTGSHSGTTSATATETVSGIDSLRYFKISNIDWDVILSAGDIVCTLDDFEFYNGVTQTTNYWQEIGA